MTLLWLLCPTLSLGFAFGLARTFVWIWKNQVKPREIPSAPLRRPAPVAVLLHRSAQLRRSLAARAADRGSSKEYKKNLEEQIGALKTAEKNVETDQAPLVALLKEHGVGTTVPVESL